MRFISMDKLIEYCVTHRCGSIPIDFIKAEKPVDVQPVTYGRWEEVSDWYGYDVHYRCSACNAEFYLEVGTPEYNGYWYCPRCGADMRNVSDKNE